MKSYKGIRHFLNLPYEDKELELMLVLCVVLDY